MLQALRKFFAVWNLENLPIIRGTPFFSLGKLYTFNRISLCESPRVVNPEGENFSKSDRHEEKMS